MVKAMKTKVDKINMSSLQKSLLTDCKIVLEEHGPACRDKVRSYKTIQSSN